MKERNRVFIPFFALCLCMVVSCGDDDSDESGPESGASYDDGEWICYDYGNECLCHVSRPDESPSPTVRVVDKCEELVCCVGYRDNYSSRCDCRNIATECQLRADQLEAEGKTSVSVVPQCPP